MGLRNLINDEYEGKDDFKSLVIIVLCLLWLFTLALLLMIVPITTDLRDRVISLEQEVYESHVSETTCVQRVEELERKLEQYEK